MNTGETIMGVKKLTLTPTKRHASRVAAIITKEPRHGSVDIECTRHNGRREFESYDLVEIEHTREGVRMVEFTRTGSPRVETTMVNLGQYCDCTCIDRQFNRARDCKHMAIAKSWTAGSRML